MKQELPSVLLKFSGKDLDLRSVPIYELGDTLIALQRIVHKTYLLQNQRWTKHAKLTQPERERISLQISEHHKSSDAYALIPFITDPAVHEYLTSLLKIGLGALLKYALQKVFSNSLEQKQQATPIKVADVQGSVLTGAIYAETVQITNHINNIGGIDTIEFIPSKDFQVPPVQFNAETQKYVRDIANSKYRGAFDEIRGYITRLLPNRLVAEIKLAPSRYIKVGLSEELFRFVRYQTEPEQWLRFKGYPIIRLGKDEATYQEFEAESVEVEDV